jgi:hypothetical protein
MTSKNALPIHRCTDVECCSFGQPTSRFCLCHKTETELLLEQREALLDACSLLLSSATDYQTGIAETEAAIARVEARS